jgi:ferredoxin
MNGTLTKGASVCITKPQLQDLIDVLKADNYRTIGPQVSQGAVIYDDLDSIEQLPVGYLDEQDGGYYRLREEGEAWFDYVVGPHSLKNFLFPPRETLVQLDRVDGGWETTVPEPAPQPLAVIGPRSCDLHAMIIQDRVFLGEAYTDPAYQTRREQLFVVAVNCRRAAATCFCHSMNTGPACSDGYDLVLTELDEHFVVQTGSDRGCEIVGRISWSPCEAEQIAAAEHHTQSVKQELESRSPTGTAAPEGQVKRRALDTTDIHNLLMRNLEHTRWDEVAERCLACTNCTLVCPTCFCASVEDVSDLSGEHVERERAWDSCFTLEHSQMTSGAVRKSIASRYRQWLTHKLATWYDQFETSGCVGCGRCITWCPVGIDLTEEVAAIRESSG